MLSRQTTLMTGIWITILPFLGFPSSWKTVLLAVTGLSLVARYFFGRVSVSAPQEVVKEDERIFVDNGHMVS